MVAYWIALGYTNNKDYQTTNDCYNDASVLGIYSTKKNAINKIIKTFKQEYKEICEDDENSEDVIKEWYEEDVDEPIIWKDIYKKLKLTLKEWDGCGGLGGYNYKLEKHVVDE